MKATPSPSVAGREKQRRSMPAAMVARKQAQRMKGTMTEGHERTAFCHAKARPMLRTEAPSMGGSQNLSTCRPFRAFPESESRSPWMPLNQKKHTAAAATSRWRTKRRRDTLLVYSLELSDANPTCFHQSQHQKLITVYSHFLCLL
ncbi:unnamed protein product [Musa acuminata subsp. burmannicoides]